MTNRPWMPLYIADWSRSNDVRMMTYEQRGVYMELLMASWASDDGGLPNNDEMLDMLIGQRGVWARVKAVVLKKFEVRGDRIFNDRLLKELEHIKAVSAKRQQAAYKRHANAGANAGANVMQLDTHSHSHSHSHSDSDIINRQTPSVGDTPADWVGNGRETQAPKKTRRKRATFDEPVYTPKFLEFWLAYPGPRKGSKAECFEKWKADGFDEHFDEVIAGLERCKQSIEWTRDNGRAVKGPIPWMNARGWTWEVTPAPKPKTANDWY